MIKLAFNNFLFTSDGNISKGKITATIKIFIENKWLNVACRHFNTKVTLHPEEKCDLNKAYKYIQAKLEKDAYRWAHKEISTQAKLTEKDLKMFNDFVEKATHIIIHDADYLTKF